MWLGLCPLDPRLTTGRYNRAMATPRNNKADPSRPATRRGLYPEIERIALLRPGAKLDADAVAELVADNARYDVFELASAAFLGNAPRALRILDGLRGEGREPPLILWALLNDLRALSRVLQHGPDERNLDGIFRAEQVWGARQGPLRTAVQRLTRADIDSLIAAAARADRVAKGSLRGDAWVEITGLVARIAGVPLAAA